MVAPIGTAGEAGRRRQRVRPPSAKALVREQEILDVAAEIFHRKGYAAATLQDIADAVGLLKGSLYYYIDSKEELLFRIASRIHDRARANLAAAEAFEGGPAAKLRTLLEGHVQSFGVELTSVRVFYTEHSALTGERRETIMAVRRAYEDFTFGLIRAGQADGSFCPDFDVHIAGNAVLTMVNTVYLWYRPGRDAPIDTVAATYADLALRGLSCPPSHAHQRPRRRTTRSR